MDWAGCKQPVCGLSINKKIYMYFQFKSTHGFEITQKACRSLEEVPYCFSRSSVKFQGHTGQKNEQF